jgi:hypothetical protein
MKLYCSKISGGNGLARFIGKDVYVHVYLLGNYSRGDTSTWIKIQDITYTSEDTSAGWCYYTTWLCVRYGINEVHKIPLHQIEFDLPIDVRTFEEVAEWYAGGN